MTGISSSSSPASPSDAVVVARNVADSLVELAWATRPGQAMTDADRYQAMIALAAGLAAVPQVLTQLVPSGHSEAPGARETFHEAVTMAHDLAGVVDAAAQHLA